MTNPRSTGSRAQGDAGVRRYEHNGDRNQLEAMKTVKPRVPGGLPPAGSHSTQGIGAIAVPTPSRTVRVEPLVRRSPARLEQQLRG
jgi:hypothetical protein